MPDIDYKLIPKIALPDSSIGDCKNWSSCGQRQVELGNGYCVSCYDRGLEKMDGNTKLRTAVATSNKE